MKRYPKLSRILSALLCVVLALSLAPAASAAGVQPAQSSNANAHEYVNGRRWADTVKSYLYENDLGGLTRVEYINNINKTVVVEDYDSALVLRASRTIPVELPVWGGFFAGEQYNFFVFGQTNPGENDRVEVIRIVKYDKSWNRLGAASLSGINTTVPFDAGSLRCAEYGGMLYIRTCHEIYAISGINHQTNLMISVRQSDMEVTDMVYEVYNPDLGYVSHSFNQYILIDQQGRIVTLDHGDDDVSDSRGIVLMRYRRAAGGDSFKDNSPVWVTPTSYTYRWCDWTTDMQVFPKEEYHYNDTGCSLGGLAETANGYVAAYTFDGTASQYGRDPRDLYLAFADKDLNAFRRTRFNADVDVYNPQLVSTGLDGGYVLFNTRDGDFYYAAYDVDGHVGEIGSGEAVLSDCAPILWKGKVVWYATRNSAPTFYLLDETGVRSVSAAGSAFSDVPESHCFYTSIRWAVNWGITAGAGDGVFLPNRTCTHVEILTFLWRAAGRPGSAFKAPVSTGTDEFDRALNWAQSKGMLGAGFDPYADCTRADAVTYIWQAMGSPATGSARFDDVPSNAPYAWAVSWAVAQGVTNGAGDNRFMPDRTCTRGEIVTFLYRAYQ